MLAFPSPSPSSRSVLLVSVAPRRYTKTFSPDTSLETRGLTAFLATSLAVVSCPKTASTTNSSSGSTLALPGLRTETAFLDNTSCFVSLSLAPLTWTTVWYPTPRLPFSVQSGLLRNILASPRLAKAGYQSKTHEPRKEGTLSCCVPWPRHPNPTDQIVGGGWSLVRVAGCPPSRTWGCWPSPSPCSRGLSLLPPAASGHTRLGIHLKW